MPKFTVTWDDDAVEDLARIWIDTTRRSAVTTAAHDLDQMLALDPLSESEEISEGLWRLTLPPISVLFEFVGTAQIKILRVGELTSGD